MTEEGFVPVANEDASLASQATSSATSSTSPRRPRGWACATASISSGDSTSISGVRMKPLSGEEARRGIDEVEQAYLTGVAAATSPPERNAHTSQ